MSNDWFRFKQFLVKQDKSSMKISTDSVLLGSWCNLDSCSDILDVGTGTGIIALMCAQRSNAHIKGIEIDVASANQAHENFSASPWSDRLEILKGDLNQLAFSIGKFDVIVCNPPYFQKSLRGKDPRKNLARHGSSLKIENLVDLANKNLNDKGRISLILPWERMIEVDQLFLERGLYPIRRTKVRSKVGSRFIRVLAEYSRCKSQISESILTIYNDKNDGYHQNFLQLTKEFYL